MFSYVSIADSGITPIMLWTGNPFLRAALNFFDMTDIGNQTLSVIVTNQNSELISEAIVNGTVTSPNGTQTQVNFTETAAGNYTINFTFDQIGNYVIAVSVNKTGFDNITGSKSIYVGLVEFTEFTGSDVFQGTTAFFDLTLRNKGNVSATVIPFLAIKTLSGTIVFSKTGYASALTANQTVSFLQHNTLVWTVGSATAGIYNATAHINFTGPDNITRQTPTKSFTFQVKAQSVTTVGGTTGGAVSGGTIIIINESVENVPTEEFVQFLNIPILIETDPGGYVPETIVVYNPTGKSINNIRIRVENIPSGWYFIENENIESVAPASSNVVNIIFTIPPDAPSGNYQGKIIFQNENLLREYSFILRINPPLPTNVMISRIAEVKEVQGRTNFIVIVRGRKDLESVSVVERIDKSIASSIDEIEFSIPPTRVIQPDPIVEWILNDLKAGEERNITYFVRKAINTTSPFIYSSVEQVVTIEKAEPPREPVINLSDILVVLPIIVIVIIILVYRSRKYREREKISEAKRFLGGLRLISERGFVFR